MSEEKKIEFLEKAIYFAKDLLEKDKIFHPFLMLLNDTQEIEFYDNEEKDYSKSYTLLEEKLKNRAVKKDIEIIVLVVDTLIPEKFAKEIPQGIRLHIEEKALISKPIGGRFLYVPYELCQRKNEALFVRLHTPISVGFPAEYIKK